MYLSFKRKHAKKLEKTWFDGSNDRPVDFPQTCKYDPLILLFAKIRATQALYW